jgi:spore maturation protein CgeB
VRVLVVDTYYPAFVARHYADRPNLARAPYREQLQALLDRHFGTGDAYSRGFRDAGHEACDVIANVEPLQRAWAREHAMRAPPVLGLAARSATRVGAAARYAMLRHILFAQVRAWQPDVIYLQDLWLLSRRDLDRLHRHAVLVVGQTASEPPEPHRLRGFDLLVTSFPHYVERFRRLGVPSEYLPIAFDAAVPDLLREVDLDPSPDGQRSHPVVFVGGVNPRVHPAGTALIERLCERTGLEVWGYGADELRPDSPIRSHHRGEAWGMDMYRVLAGSKMVVNRHIEAAEGNANNMRLFEATGCGALVLTEVAPNLADLFTAGKEVVTYGDEDELVDLIGHYSMTDHERREIARAGQIRTLAEHTYTRRISELTEILGAYLSR